MKNQKAVVIASVVVIIAAGSFAFATQPKAEPTEPFVMETVIEHSATVPEAAEEVTEGVTEEVAEEIKDSYGEAYSYGEDIEVYDAYEEPDEPESYGDQLTRSGGVYYNDESGYTETWYSSNVAHHYRTDEWAADDEGVYRDADGYVVVASSDLAQGETVETSHGTGKVYDDGCASGIVDVYVEW